MEKRTNSTLKYLKDMWNGDAFPSEKTKFNAICYALAAIHLILTIIFFALGYKLVGIYFCLTIYLYVITLTVMLRSERYYHVFIIAYSEISVTSVLLTWFFGWNWGFMMYIIALCPVSFFVTYSLTGVKRTLSRPLIFSAISLVLFSSTRIACSYVEPFYNDYADTTVATTMYMLNCFITFITIMAFSILFSLDVRCKEKILETQNEELSDISSIDPLTKLLNRRAMGQCLETAVNQTKKTGELFSLTIGDIDNFKMVNDVHGHNVGDDVLKMVASTIRENLPEKAILARWGGEEFLILTRKSEADSIPDIEAIRYAISQQTVKVEKPDGYIDLGVTMTFGISQYIHGFTIDQVISLADENLYKGKSNGKNRVVHSKTAI